MTHIFKFQVQPQMFLKWIVKEIRKFLQKEALLHTEI